MTVSFEQAFASEFTRLHRFLQRRVGAAAADLAAETFATAYANWERFDQERPIRPWLYGIAANHLRHHWRDERRMLRAFARTGVDPIVGEEEPDVARVEARERYREFAAAVAELRPREREMLLLHAWAELSDGEIAQALGVPVGTVKSRLSRIRERLRNQLQPRGRTAIRELLATSKERRRAIRA
jgi:RNA polymerase sigma factor (sigma-70 family)